MTDTSSAVPLPNNWGRWGPEDERGTLNLVTPERVLAAAGCVRRGEVLGLALPIAGSTSSPARANVPHLPGRPLPQHFMSIDGGDYAAGSRPVGDGIRMSDDALMISPHGTTTHVDALCHMWHGDQLYNGHDANRLRSYGAARCGIDKFGGLTTRGVLLDIAAHLGVPRLDPTSRIDRALLTETAAAGNVVLHPGDVVVIRTGWPTVHAEDPTQYAYPQPGLSYDAGLWLAENDVAVVAMDNLAIAALDERGRTQESAEEDLHLLFLWRHGIHLLEMLWLEEISAALTDGPLDFLFMLAPLPVNGGTASSVQPLAIL